jgi:hypothetical protein
MLGECGDMIPPGLAPRVIAEPTRERRADPHRPQLLE